MTSSSKSQCSGPRFSDYLNGLREEFFKAPSVSMRSRRFNIYIEGLKCEFEDIESLRDELQAKVEAQAMEIQDIRNTNVECRLGIQQKPRPSTRIPVTRRSYSAITPSSPLKIAPSSSTKIPSRVVNPSRQLLCSSTQHIKVTPKSHSATTTPTGSFQSTSNTISRRPHPIDGRAQTNTPSPLPHTPASTVDPNSALKVRNCSTTFNDEVGKELSIELAHEISHEESIRCVNFSQDGKYLAAGCEDGKSYVYDAQTGTLILVLRDLLAEHESIRSVCFSCDGKYLATGAADGGIYIWEIKKKFVRNAFKGHTRWISSLDFSPNGRLLVSALVNCTVRLWNMRDGSTKVLTDNNLTPSEDAHYNSAVFSPDGRHVAASHRDGTVRVWLAHTGQLMRRVKAHMDVVFDVKFTPDGKGLVSGGTDRILKYWDLSSWNPIFIRARSQTSDLDRCFSAVDEQIRPEREYSGHDDRAYCLAISPDGRWVASGSYDKTVRIWGARSTSMQYSLNHNHWVLSVDFSPAGHYLASGAYDGMVRIWRYSHIPSDGISSR